MKLLKGEQTGRTCLKQANKQTYGMVSSQRGDPKHILGLGVISLLHARGVPSCPDPVGPGPPWIILGGGKNFDQLLEKVDKTSSQANRKTKTMVIRVMMMMMMMMGIFKEGNKSLGRLLIRTVAQEHSLFSPSSSFISFFFPANVNCLCLRHNLHNSALNNKNLIWPCRHYNFLLNS